MDKPTYQPSYQVSVLDQLGEAALNGRHLYLNAKETADLSSLVLATVDAARVLRRALDNYRNTAGDRQMQASEPVPEDEPLIEAVPEKEDSQVVSLRYDVLWVLMKDDDVTVRGTECSRYITDTFFSEKDALEAILRRERSLRLTSPRLNRYVIRSRRADNGQEAGWRTAETVQNSLTAPTHEEKAAAGNVDKKDAEEKSDSVWYEIDAFFQDNGWVPQIMPKMLTEEESLAKLSKLDGHRCTYRLVRCSRQIGGGVARSVIKTINPPLFAVMRDTQDSKTTVLRTGSDKEELDRYAREMAAKEENPGVVYRLASSDFGMCTTISRYKAPYLGIEGLSLSGLWSVVGHYRTQDAAIAMMESLHRNNKRTAYRVVAHDVDGAFVVTSHLSPVWYEVEADPVVDSMSSFNTDRPGLRDIRAAISVWLHDPTRCTEVADAVVQAWKMHKSFRSSGFNINLCSYDKDGKEQRKAVALFVRRDGLAGDRWNTALKDCSRPIAVLVKGWSGNMVGCATSEDVADLMRRIAIAEPYEEEKTAKKSPPPAEKFSDKVNRLRRVVMACVGVDDSQFDDSQFDDSVWISAMDRADKSRSTRMETEGKKLRWLCDWFHVIPDAAVRRIERRLSLKVTAETTIGSIIDQMEKSSNKNKEKTT